MARRERKKLGNQKIYAHWHHRLREGGFIFVLALSVFLMIALITYHSTDPGWSQTGSGLPIANAAGRTGAFLADFFLYLFGYLAFIFPMILVGLSWLILREGYIADMTDLGLVFLRFGGFILFMLSGDGLTNLLIAHAKPVLPFESGGILGSLIASALVDNVNLTGSFVLLSAGFLIGITLATGVSWFGLVGRAGNVYFSREKLTIDFARFIPSKQVFLWPFKSLALQVKSLFEKKEAVFTPEPPVLTRVEPAIEKRSKRITPTISLVPKTFTPELPNDFSAAPPSFTTHVKGTFPSLDLLGEPAAEHYEISDEHLQQLSQEVEARLEDFGVKAEVVAAYPGPVITRFELSLAPGLKVNRITALNKDLARSLSTISVRVVEVIPGKAVVGLEIPNTHRKIVRLREIIGSEQYQQARSPISLALGTDISGNPVVVDIAKMPHLLVAGTTGSGKSVSINVMLLSLLYKATPDQVRLILVDPKMLELSVYEGIPHLLTPVVTDMRDAANALRWSVAEMERRYQLMSHLGVRHLAGYSEKVCQAIDAGEPLRDPTQKAADLSVEEPRYLSPLPYIVIIIDEFADMMMVVGKKVEELIARIAQKARAAGIHLVLATQRPSVDVITGLIKSNIPTRMSFQVSSRIDSRMILDQSGAEQLLGHDDMLYLPPGSGVPVRIHGAYVSDQEVHRVVADWKKRSSPTYLPEILAMPESGSFSSDGILSDEDTAETDPLYDQAVRIVTETRRASISSVQRRLKIGYNRAARLIEAMESAGIVTSMESNGNREVLAPPPPTDE